jgi:predicted DNA-binding transcriptional regulator AlpA
MEHIMPRTRTPVSPAAHVTSVAWHADLHPALTAAALVDGPSAAAAAAMSISQWRTLVAEGIAPKPVICRPRFSRWRAADVRAFLDRIAAGEVEL